MTGAMWPWLAGLAALLLAGALLLPPVIESMIYAGDDRLDVWGDDDETFLGEVVTAPLGPCDCPQCRWASSVARARVQARLDVIAASRGWTDWDEEQLRMITGGGSERAS